MKQYWLTAISALMGTTLVVLPILGGLFGDTEGDAADERTTPTVWVWTVAES